MHCSIPVLLFIFLVRAKTRPSQLLYNIFKGIFD